MLLETTQLHSIALFDGLPPDQLEFVAAHARQRTHRPEQAILHMDDPGEKLYIILQGTVKISATLPDGRNVFLALLGTGDTFGELSLIDSGFRSADVVTQEETRLLSVDRDTFEALMDMPTFPRNLMRILARRLRLANVRIQAHCTLDAPGLVARQLLEFADLYGTTEPDGSRRIPIRLTQGDMADLVGKARESVNKVMVTYKDKGWISVDAGHRITIRKPSALQRELEQR